VITTGLNPSGRRVVASIEARMGSSRLPGKALMDVNGEPALKRVVNRLRRCKTLDDVIVATSTSAADDPLAEWCEHNDIRCHRGSEDDVLQRVVDAHRAALSDIVVEITGDCVLTDPAILDLGVETFFAHDADVVTNCGSVLTWPMGVYVQVFPLVLLEEVARTVHDSAVREHVSLYFYEHPERYRAINLLAPAPWRAPDYRLQLDYPEDLMFITEVYRALEPTHGEGFGVGPVMELLRRDPGLIEINRHCTEKTAR
jgi:spore coat polysaccharide biosynthesis protein SpsF